MIKANALGFSSKTFHGFLASLNVSSPPCCKAEGSASVTILPSSTWCSSCFSSCPWYFSMGSIVAILFQKWKDAGATNDQRKERGPGFRSSRFLLRQGYMDEHRETPWDNSRFRDFEMWYLCTELRIKRGRYEQLRSISPCLWRFHKEAQRASAAVSTRRPRAFSQVDHGPLGDAALASLKSILDHLSECGMMIPLECELLRSGRITVVRRQRRIWFEKAGQYGNDRRETLVACSSRRCRKDRTASPS